MKEKLGCCFGLLVTSALNSKSEWITWSHVSVLALNEFLELASPASPADILTVSEHFNTHP